MKYIAISILIAVATHGLCELGYVISYSWVFSLLLYRIQVWGWVTSKSLGSLKILPMETHLWDAPIKTMSTDVARGELLN